MIGAAGFELEDRDRDNGRYHVVVSTGQDEADEGGFFSFLSFGGSDEVVESHSITIQVKSGDDQVQAFIAEYQDSLTAELRKEVLTRIKDQLI